MPNTPTVRFTVTNLAYSIANIVKGISFVEGVTKRGPISDPSQLMTSWEKFIKVYGGYTADSQFPLLCERAFMRGAQLRVSRVAHYTDNTDRNTLTADKATVNSPFKFVFDAALVASNNIDIDIDGVNMATVPFNTDSDTTMSDIAGALANMANVENAVVITGPAADDDLAIIVWLTSNVDTPVINAAVTGGASQANITVEDVLDVVDATGNSLFTPTMKYYGADYNNVYLQISDASNGFTNYFNLSVVHALEPSLTETYQNLKIPNPVPGLANLTYLDAVKTASQLLDFAYIDISALSGNVRPINGIYYFFNGSDGGTITDADYTGSSAGRTGFYAFDDFDDAMQVAAPEMSSSTIHQAGSAYAELRKDLMYYAHLDNSLTTADAYAAARNGFNIDSIYTAFFAGGLSIKHPSTNQVTQISEMGDVLGLAAYVDSTLGEWRAHSGREQGQIYNVLGVVNNFGSPARYNDLNLLANRQINMVVQRDGIVYLNGNFSGDLETSPLSFRSIVRLIIFIQKSIKPTAERYLDKPNDIPSWKNLFREVEPFLNALVTGRAMYSYRWRGDQDVSRIEDVVINNLNDIELGKYKVRLFIKPTPSIQEIAIDIVITPLAVDFELVTNVTE